MEKGRRNPPPATRAGNVASSLAELIGVTSQSPALWEKGEASIEPPSGKLLRLTVKGHYTVQITVWPVIDALNHRDEDDHAAHMVFQQSDKKWNCLV